MAVAAYFGAVSFWQCLAHIFGGNGIDDATFTLRFISSSYLDFPSFMLQILTFSWTLLFSFSLSSDAPCIMLPLHVLASCGVGLKAFVAVVPLVAIQLFTVWTALNVPTFIITIQYLSYITL